MSEKAKKPKSFLLRPDTITAIKKISIEKDISQNEVVELLVKQFLKQINV